MKNLPQVVIVGRTNVGKSTLFNRLSADTKSLAFDYHGVTRDFITDVVSWNERSFTLVDTGGVSLRKIQDPINEQVRQRALSMLEKAQLVLFVCDSKFGLVPEDREIAKLLHSLKKKVILVLNKSDVKDATDNVTEFSCLGFGPGCFISAQHGMGIADILEAIVAALPVYMGSEEEGPAYKVVLLGKPNVGKSSLMNLLVQDERSIVNEQAGTTREAVSDFVKFYKADIQVTDTPGIRRKRGVTEPLEMLMVKSALRASDNADIVLLMVDAAEGQLSDQELKLAFHVFDNYKALILVLNKQDLLTEQNKGDMAFSMEEYEFFLKKVPQITVSCKTGKNVGKILPLVQKIWQHYSQQFNNEEVTMLCKQALDRRPLFHKTERLTLYEVKQLATAPITFLLVVNEPRWFGQSQLAFFDNTLRGNYDLLGAPIKFVIRKSS